VNELVALDLGDIDAQDGLVHVRGKAARSVYLEPALRGSLHQYLHGTRGVLTGRNYSAALFTNQRGERLTRQWVWAVVANAAQNAGMDKSVGPHTLRHSYAVRQLEGGTSVEHLQEILGNMHLVNTRVYERVAAGEEHPASSQDEGS
jgi:integrase/recombinase XerD